MRWFLAAEAHGVQIAVCHGDGLLPVTTWKRRHGNASNLVNTSLQFWLPFFKNPAFFYLMKSSDLWSLWGLSPPCDHEVRLPW